MVDWAPVRFNWQRTRHADMSGPFFAPFLMTPYYFLVHYPGKIAYLIVFIVNFWISQFIKYK